MTLIVRSEIVRAWLVNSDALTKVRAIDGVVVRSKEGRTTQRFEIEGHGFYAKLHEGVGWREVFKNLLQGRLPIIGASNEWLAINRLQELGLKTLTAVAFGEWGHNPAQQKSFIITDELIETLHLAEVTENWQQSPPPLLFKRAVIDRVATISKLLHQDGINHRDLYLCHFLLDQAAADSDSNPDFYLVDLHRAQMRQQVPRRWLVKDVASLYFSSMDRGLTRRDIYRFIKTYTGLPLREALSEKAEFWQQVRKRAHRLYVRDWKRPPVDIFNGQ
ncbi:MAG: heptose I phosphotransferase [Oceanicoccus sp.]|jgi:heptose I phosphotransferase